MTKEIEGRLLKAKIELMTRSAFISTIALSMRHIITKDIPTAAISRTRIMYNPDFIKDLSIPKLAGLMAHECWHVAFMHLARRGTRDPIIWNVAGDCVINNMLIKAAFELPPKGIINPKYNSTWATDAVYDDLIKECKDFSGSELMLDIIGDEESPELDSEITDIIIRARMQSEIANEAGSIPGEILRIIDELLNPKLPWPVILNRFLDQRVHEEYSWSRRNRRFNSAYLPSMFNNGLGHLTFAIDTSGSIEGKELKEMLSEIKGIQQTFMPEKMTIIDCDSRIHTVYDINQNTDILSLEFHGGGGTRFQPVLDYVSENPTQALIYFTDLYGERELKEVEYPILWICNSDHDPAPIGETVYVE